MLPFDQTLKRKVVVRGTYNKETVRVYVQGAPEEILKLCSSALNERDE